MAQNIDELSQRRKEKQENEVYTQVTLAKIAIMEAETYFLRAHACLSDEGHSLENRRELRKHALLCERLAKKL